MLWTAWQYLANTNLPEWTTSWRTGKPGSAVLRAPGDMLHGAMFTLASKIKPPGGNFQFMTLQTPVGVHPSRRGPMARFRLLGGYSSLFVHAVSKPNVFCLERVRSCEVGALYGPSTIASMRPFCLSSTAVGGESTNLQMGQVREIWLRSRGALRPSRTAQMDTSPQHLSEVTYSLARLKVVGTYRYL